MSEKLPTSKSETPKDKENPSEIRVFKRDQRKEARSLLTSVNTDLDRKEKWDEEESKKAVETLKKVISMIENARSYDSFPSDIDFSALKFPKNVSPEERADLKRVYSEHAMEHPALIVYREGEAYTNVYLDKESGVEVKCESREDLTIYIEKTFGEPEGKLLLAIEDENGKPLILQEAWADRTGSYGASKDSLGFEAWKKDLFVRTIPFEDKKKTGPYR